MKNDVLFLPLCLVLSDAFSFLKELTVFDEFVSKILKKDALKSIALKKFAEYMKIGYEIKKLGEEENGKSRL